MVSEEKIFEIVDGRRTDAGQTPDHGHPISSPCEPNSSGELKMGKKCEPQFYHIKVGMKGFTFQGHVILMIIRVSTT